LNISLTLFVSAVDHLLYGNTGFHNACEHVMSSECINMWQGL